MTFENIEFTGLDLLYKVQPYTQGQSSLNLLIPGNIPVSKCVINSAPDGHLTHLDMTGTILNFPDANIVANCE